MKYRYLFPGMVDYPAGIAAFWRSDPLPVLTVAGNTGVLRAPAMCLLSSSEIPPDLILPAFDLAIGLRVSGIAMAGGFHGEVEGVCLGVLLAGSGPLVVCPARSLDAINISRRHQERVDAGTLVYLSSERSSCRRPTVQIAMRRNDLLLGLADRMIALSAPPGSRALKSAIGFLERGHPVACFDHRRNRDLLLLGATPIAPSGHHLRPLQLRPDHSRERTVDPIAAFLHGPPLSGEGPASGGGGGTPSLATVNHASRAFR